MTTDEDFLAHPRDFVKRLQAFATLTLGRRPTSGQVQQAINQHVMKAHGTDREAMTALARELFPVTSQEAPQ